MTSIIRIVLVSLATVAGACVWLCGGASAASPEGMRLYVFSSGWLTLDKSGLQTGATGKITVPVAFFLIKHPKGNVLFETGNNDKIITDPTYWGPLAAALEPGRSPDVAIDVQLDKIGVKSSDINYVILGHMHLDHAGNVGKFPTATIVYQRDEIVNAFWPKPGYGCCYITADFAMLRNDVGQNAPNRQKVIELNGDLDLFGDGSIYIHRQVGQHSRKPDGVGSAAEERPGRPDQRYLLPDGEPAEGHSAERSSSLRSRRDSGWLFLDQTPDVGGRRGRHLCARCRDLQKAQAGTGILRVARASLGRSNPTI